MTAPPEGTRVHFSEKTGHTNQSQPTWSEFAKDDKTWNILDTLRKIAKEVGKNIGISNFKSPDRISGANTEFYKRSDQNQPSLNIFQND